MYKIRIKSSPSDKETGQQEEYGLVRNNAAIQVNPEQVKVNNKMGAVPREQANIEVEGGESVIGDVNKDGIMELMHFTGKRHSEGGVPVNIPEGSFIFSDTKNLRIKDPEILEKIFNLPPRKQGYTPAEISKKFEINQYVQILKDDTADEMTKRSAAEMLRKNKQKLGILAFIQESMKGFPDGIPTIAEEVLATMGISPDQLIQQANDQLAQDQQAQMQAMQQQMPTQPGQDMMGMPPAMPDFNPEQAMPLSAEEEAMMAQQGAPQQMPPEMMGRYGGTMKKYQAAGTVGGIGEEELRLLLAQREELLSKLDLLKSDYYTVSEDNKLKQVPQLKTPVSQKKQELEIAYYENKIKQINDIISGVGLQETKPINLPETQILGNRQGPFIPEGLGNSFDMMYDALRKNPYSEYAYQKMQEGFPEYPEPKEEIIPGFGSMENFLKFRNSGVVEEVVADSFYDALQSKDYNKLLAFAQDLQDNDSKYDVDYSVGWLPWTNQDKIQDLKTIAQEQALKLLNDKQKEILLSDDYSEKTIKAKLTDILNDLTEQQNGLTGSAKLNVLSEKQKYKNFFEQISAAMYDDRTYHQTILDDIKNSNVINDPSFGFIPNMGSPIQDPNVDWTTKVTTVNPDGSETSKRGLTYFDILDDITKKHDILKGTNVSTTKPLAFRGQTMSISRGSKGMPIGISSDTFERDISNVQKVANKMQGIDSSAMIMSDKSNRPEYVLPSDPYAKYYIETLNDGSLVFSREGREGIADKGYVTDQKIVDELNNIIKAKTNKVSAIKPFVDPNETPALDVVIPTSDKTVTNKNLRDKNAQTESTNTPKSQTQSVQSEIEDPNFYLNLESQFQSSSDTPKKQYGGQIGSMIRKDDKLYRFGGTIDERGRILRKYVFGAEVDDVTNDDVTDNNSGTTANSQGSTTVNSQDRKKVLVTKTKEGYEVYREAWDDNTSYYYTIDPKDGKTIKVANAQTGKVYSGDYVPTRSNNDWVDPKSLTAYEQQEVNKHWAGNAQAYADYVNLSNQMSTNKELANDMWTTFERNRKDSSRGMYTGKTQETKNKHYNRVGADIDKMTKQEMMTEFLAQEERNARLAAVKGEDWVKGTSQNPASKSGQGQYTNAEILQAMKDNASLSDLDFSQGHKGQAAYIAYRQALMENPQKYAGKAMEWQAGVGDETIMGLPAGTISGTEGYSTNTTAAQRAGWKVEPPKKEKEKEKDSKDKTKEKEAYYCVEANDGSRHVETVKYNDGTQPTPPSGANVKSATVLQSPNDKCAAPYDGGTPKEPNQSRLQFTPDLVNTAQAMGQIIPKTPPTLRQMPYNAYSGYVLRNPITQIAGITGLTKQQQDLAMNTMDPSVAFAATAGLGYDQLAQQIAGVENDNVNTVNRYLDTFGNRQAQIDQLNMQGRRQFDVDSAVYRDEVARDINTKNAQVAKMFGQGFKNMMDDNAMRVAYPNAWHVSRPLGTFGWSGVGRDPLMPDTYYSPVSGKGNSNVYDVSTGAQNAYDDAYRTYLQTHPEKPEEAKRHAEDMRRYFLQQQKSQGSGASSQQEKYNQSLRNKNFAANNQSSFGASYNSPMDYMNYYDV
jgi:hypothetical protein